MDSINLPCVEYYPKNSPDALSGHSSYKFVRRTPVQPGQTIETTMTLSRLRRFVRNREK